MTQIHYGAVVRASQNQFKAPSTVDEDDFEDIMGSTNGFQDSEAQSYNGMLLETGLEYILSNKSGLRLNGKYVEIETAKFDNLDDNSLTIDHYTISLLLEMR